VRKGPILGGGFLKHLKYRWAGVIILSFASLNRGTSGDEKSGGG